jgi:8-oxo-dGTP diphosphatase
MDKVTLAGCAILKDQAILLLHRIKKDWYELPGGKIDGDETPEEAAERELREELSCDIEIIRKLGEKDFQENGYVLGYTWFLAQIEEGQTPYIGEPQSFDEYKYIPLAELTNYSLSPNMQNFVEELEKGTIKIN